MKLQTHEKCFIPVRGIAPARSNRKHSDSGEHSRASGITGGRHSFSTGRRRCGTSLTGALRETRRDAAPSPSLARLDHRGGTAHAPFWTGARGSCTRGAWTATLGVRAVCLALITRARARAHPHTRPRAGALCVVQQRRSVSVQRPYRRYRRYCCRVRQALGTRLDVRHDQNIREEVQVM
jgi:hypothetical protein